MPSRGETYWGGGRCYKGFLYWTWVTSILVWIQVWLHFLGLLLIHFISDSLIHCFFSPPPPALGFGSFISKMEETYSTYFFLLLENKLNYLHVVFCLTRLLLCWERFTLLTRRLRRKCLPRDCFSNVEKCPNLKYDTWNLNKEVWEVVKLWESCGWDTCVKLYFY